MKLSLNCCTWLLLLSLCLILISSTEGGKKGGAKNGACKYNKKGKESECNTSTNTKEITYTLKKGDAECQATIVKKKPCSNSKPKKAKGSGCKYEKQGATWTECDPVTKKKSKEMKLKAGSGSQCPPTQTKTKSCKPARKAAGQ
ncbi:pleiotrophin-like [Physella acuta]|uniref:pleiotrophin-like n=1 Tax=Physella acuta TaxID=109671 RepID=UPI0027DD6F57|nr:pleiotrophin-like [Physella acuta]XP_059145750.1 pleiotrophin-like [Physella acuta]XP_059145751.1 pleiotrophin-like [Physella acuta]XP_059145752.1 pleiotrophin-like [Physella acuta]